MKLKKINLSLGQVEIKLDDNDQVIDFVTGKKLKILSKSPEEIVRQWYEHILVENCRYGADQIDIEVPIKMGSSPRKADIVVYDSPLKVKKLIIIETKKHFKKDGIDQLQSYLEATGVEFGVWTNGDDISHWYHREPQSYEPIGRIINQGETINDIGATKLREELVPAKDIVSDFKAIEQYILAHQGGIDIFDEIFKVIFAKIYDEKKNLKSPKSEAQFRAGIKEPPSSVKKRIASLFGGAKNIYSDVFRETEQINFNDQVLKWVTMLLQNYILVETDMDILGVGFEVLVNPKMISDKGQYFTPRQVVRTAVEMLQIDENMRIVDPACGSGGFLIYSMERVWKKLDKEWASDLDALAEKLSFAQTKIFGTDYDDRLARVAKAYMAIWGDGRAHIYAVPCAIKSYEFKGEIAEQIKDGTFDAVLTNPPFAGDLDLRNIAHHFDLGKKNGNELIEQRKDILFIERVLKLAKPAAPNEKSGFVAIVLPKGDLDEREKQYVRDYILENSQILAVISLHKLTFVPYTQQKTSLVLLKRMPKEQIPDDYPIYMAVSERPGKNKSGNLIYERDSSNNIVIDEYGRSKLYTDLYEIAHEFIKKNPKIGFYVKRSELVGRINAEYYNPKYMKIRKKVTRENYFLLREILYHEKNGIINGKDTSTISKDGKRHYSDEGLPYLRVGDVMENEIDMEGAEKIDPSEYDLSKIPKVEVGDLLITRKGTTGRVSVVSNDEIETVLSSEIIRVRLKKECKINGERVLIDPYYVAAYLNSTYGKQLIIQKQTGGISEGINQPDLKEIEIPILSQSKMDEISKVYRNANIELKNARKKIHDMTFNIERILE